jgi:hypothetical protein
MLQNPRGAASILSDYVGGYDFYETEQQKKDIEAAGGKAIQLVQGTNGIATPKLTADQEKEARAVLDRLVDSRVDVKKEQPRPVEKTKSDGDGGGGDDVSINNRRALVEQIYNDPNSNSQYVLNKPFKINNRDVKIVSARPIEMMDKNRNPLKGIELVASYDFVNPKNGKITTTTELITESGEAAKRVINDLLNASLIPSETISYEKAFFNNPGTKKSGAGARYN